MGVQSCFEWGRYYPVGQDLLRDTGGKMCVSLTIPHPCHSPVCIAFVTHLLLHLSHFSSYRPQVTRIFPDKRALQMQMVIGFVPTEVSMKTRAHKNSPCTKMGLQRSDPL